MKILAIMGSPRKHGNTYVFTEAVEEGMRRLGSVEFEYAFLRDLDIGMCRGCRLCMDRGEEYCPMSDGLAELETKMLEADGVVFASPTYVGNVSGLMKNLVDRLCYACHRPRFFKNALLLTTSGGGGAGFMLMALGIAVEATGFKVAHKAGAVVHERRDRVPPKELGALEARNGRAADRAARAFYEAVRAGTPAPGIVDMARFSLARKAHLRDEPGSPDRRYWEERGWHEKGVSYYYGPTQGLIKRMLAEVAARALGLAAR